MLKVRLLLATSVALLCLSSLAPVPPVAASQESAPDWQTSTTYKLRYQGRSASDTVDNYLVQLDWGATLFDIATESVPLVPPMEVVDALLKGITAANPDRTASNIQPGDSFVVQFPAGTVVAAKWRLQGSVTEFESFRGDRLEVYHDYRSLITYRLRRVESLNSEEVGLNQEADLKANPLAQSVYGRGDPGFKPDFFQVSRVRELIVDEEATITIDVTRQYIDDFREMKAGSKPAGPSANGLEGFWIQGSDAAQPAFRVDDGIRDATDLAAVPELMRIYYYKDGTVRVYRRIRDSMLLSDRQPMNDIWASVFEQYGKLSSVPSRWEIGQPEQDGQAQELSKLGIVVLRFEPKPPPPSNLFTQLLDFLMSMMKRKEG